MIEFLGILEFRWVWWGLEIPELLDSCAHPEEGRIVEFGIEIAEHRTLHVQIQFGRNEQSEAGYYPAERKKKKREPDDSRTQQRRNRIKSGVRDKAEEGYRGQTINNNHTSLRSIAIPPICI